MRVGFVIGSDGRPRELRVVRGVDPVLDQAAREAVERAAPLPVVAGPLEIDLDFALTD